MTLVQIWQRMIMWQNLTAQDHMCLKLLRAQTARLMIVQLAAMERCPSLDLVDSVWWELDALKDPAVQGRLESSFVAWKACTPNAQVKIQHHTWHNQFDWVAVLGNCTLRWLANVLVPRGLQYHGLTSGKAEWMGAVFEAWLLRLWDEDMQTCEKIHKVMASIKQLQQDAWFSEWLTTKHEWDSWDDYMEMRAWMVNKRRQQRALVGQHQQQQQLAWHPEPEEETHPPQHAPIPEEKVTNKQPVAAPETLEETEEDSPEVVRRRWGDAAWKWQ